MAETGRNRGEIANTPAEDQKKPEENRNYAAALKNQKEQRNQKAAAPEAEVRWDVATCSARITALPEPCSSCHAQPASLLSAFGTFIFGRTAVGGPNWDTSPKPLSCWSLGPSQSV